MDAATLLRVMADLALSPITLCVTLWVRHQEARVLRDGTALSADQCALALAAGVVETRKIRVMPVRQMPMPLPDRLRRFAERRGWLSLHIAGMTFGYGIVLRADSSCDGRLLAHEFTHVTQYERLGLHAGFLRHYVRECVWPGYPYGPLESEARRAEALVVPTQPRENVIPYATL